MSYQFQQNPLLIDNTGYNPFSSNQNSNNVINIKK